jgi:hypothetical protein
MLNRTIPAYGAADVYEHIKQYNVEWNHHRTLLAPFHHTNAQLQAVRLLTLSEDPVEDARLKAFIDRLINYQAERIVELLGRRDSIEFLLDDYRET